MGWTRDPSDLVWETTLTARTPRADPLPIGYLTAATLQVDGPFGAGVVTVALGNAPGPLLAVETFRHADLVPLTPMLPVRWLGVVVEDASDDTAITVTVVGAR